MKIDETDVIRVMKNVNDPELLLNVVELGLLYKVNLDNEEKKIGIEMTLTTRGCPLGDMIVSTAESLLQSEFPDFKICVNLVWEPKWTPEKMSAEAKESLNKR